MNNFSNVLTLLSSSGILAASTIIDNAVFLPFGVSISVLLVLVNAVYRWSKMEVKLDYSIDSWEKLSSHVRKLDEDVQRLKVKCKLD